MSTAISALREEAHREHAAAGPRRSLRALRGDERRGVAAGAVATVLAGGRGERLQPLTRERAKPALPFASVHRIVDFTLANCVNSGIERIRVLTQYQSASVEEHVRGRWHERARRRGQRIDLCPAADPRRAGAGYRGTADAVFRNLHASGDARWVLVLGADHLYRMDYREMIAAHVESGAEVTIAATAVPLAEARRMGVVTTDASTRIRAFDEKPAVPSLLPGHTDLALASMGIYVFSRASLVRELGSAARDREHDFGRDVIPAMVRGGARVFAYPFRDPGSGRPGYWRDVGTLDSYFDAHMEMLAGDPGIDLDRDRRRFTVTAAGIVVVPKGAIVEA
jgi:glucose-1-phosphate adenylyltransferase